MALLPTRAKIASLRPMKSFLRVRLQQVPDNLEDVITQHSFDYGASGVSEALAFVQPDLTYDPQVITPKQRELDIYFSESPARPFFDRLLEWNKNIKWQVFEEEEKDWLEEWKKGFKPFALVEPYWIVPSWFESPVAPEHAIRIDPGMAFGTGTHATTKLASHFLSKRLKENPGGKAPSLLDVGTGTAVLSILASRMGYQPIVGLEIDPEARRVARENVERNDVPVQILDEQLEEHHETYDVVVANIIDGVLINLKQPLIRATRLGGDIFLTGILVEREEIFSEGFINSPELTVVRRWQNEEWVGYWVRRIS